MAIAAKARKRELFRTFPRLLASGFRTIMQLPSHLLVSFRHAWRTDFGIDITDEEANGYALSVIDYMMTLAGYSKTRRQPPSSCDGDDSS